MEMEDILQVDRHHPRAERFSLRLDVTLGKGSIGRLQKKILLFLCILGIATSTVSAQERGKTGAGGSEGKESMAESPDSSGEQQNIQTDGRRYVILGDSYLKRNKKCLYRYILKQLGLKDDQAVCACASGHGFAKDRKTFSDLLRKLSGDKTVTDVLVIGGAGNDRQYSEDAIKIGIQDFSLLARKKFPNAVLTMAQPCWNSASFVRQKEEEIRKVWYQEACIDYGWIYLSECERVLYGHPEYMMGDHRHPNPDGAKAIAAAVKSGMRKRVLARKLSFAKKMTLRQGSTVRLSAVISPKNVTIQSVGWSSSHPEVAMVMQNRELIALKPGTARITLTTLDGTHLTRSCQVKVK